MKRLLGELSGRASPQQLEQGSQMPLRLWLERLVDEYYQALELDPRSAGVIPSTKGSL